MLCCKHVYRTYKNTSSPSQQQQQQQHNHHQQQQRQQQQQQQQQQRDLKIGDSQCSDAKHLRKIAFYSQRPLHRQNFFQMFGGESPGYKRGAREDMEEHLVSPTDRYFLDGASIS